MTEPPDHWHRHVRSLTTPGYKYHDGSHRRSAGMLSIRIIPFVLNSTKEGFHCFTVSQDYKYFDSAIKVDRTWSISSDILTPNLRDSLVVGMSKL